jgi:hypothetical protein
MGPVFGLSAKSKKPLFQRNSLSMIVSQSDQAFVPSNVDESMTAKNIEKAVLGHHDEKIRVRDSSSNGNGRYGLFEFSI